MVLLNDARRDDMGMRKTVHFSANIDDDIRKHAESFGNFSGYVKKLIREDMHRNPQDKRRKARPTTKPSENVEVAPAVSQPPARPRKYSNPQPNNPPPFRPQRSLSDKSR
jgi:hypothetical protein